MSNNPNQESKGVLGMTAQYQQTFKSVTTGIKDLRKSADTLLQAAKARKEQLILAKEQEEARVQAALLAQEAKARQEAMEAEALQQELERRKQEEALAQEAAKAEAETITPSQPQEAIPEEDTAPQDVQAVMDNVQETATEETAPQAEAAPIEASAEAPQETVQEVKEEVKVEAPVEKPAKEEAKQEIKAGTTFVPKDRGGRDLSQYRAQNVQEPRKFVPPAAKAPQGAGTRPVRGDRPPMGAARPQSPSAGTTFVPPQSGPNNRRTNPGQKEFDRKRDFDQKSAKGGKGRREAVEEVSEAELNRRFKQRGKKGKQEVETIRIEHAVVSVDPVPIKLLAEKIGKPATEIVKKLLQIGVFKNVNDSIAFDEAELMALDFGVTLELKVEETLEDKLTAYVEKIQEDDTHLTKRAPVVTIMGHVDHGKTSLLDYIRKANVAKGEAGGITQHIGAYTIRLRGEKITFIDTPGHEAFTTMRARGAQVTDVAVIVVAADDSIMPQTVESINHAKAAGVPIIVAINKIDKPGANIDRVKNDLTKYDLLIEEWGGDTICVPVSAKTGEGVEELLEQILLVAEVGELKANPQVPAKGTIIEARLDHAIGSVATILVQNGTLKVGDYVVAGAVTGKIKKMMDDKGGNLTKAGPSIPVSVLGFDSVPNAGDQCLVVEEKLARSIAEERRIKERLDRLSRASNNLENIFKTMTEGKLKELNLIVKADVQGSVEAVCQELKKLSNEEVKVSIIHSGVGAVNESDVMLAMTSSAIIIAFNVRPDAGAKATAAKENVDIRTYRVIYEAIDEINLALKGMLAPKFREVVLGHAEVRDTFRISSIGTIAGCYVTDGKMERNSGIRLLRDNVVIYEGKLASLRRVKDDVKEVLTGFECGMGLEKYNDIKVGDVMECYTMEQIKN